MTDTRGHARHRSSRPTTWLLRSSCWSRLLVVLAGDIVLPLVARLSRTDRQSLLLRVSVDVIEVQACLMVVCGRALHWWG